MSIISRLGPVETGHASIVLRGSDAICGAREVIDHSQIIRVCAFPFEEVERYAGLLRTAGCYILAERDFHASVLKGGLNALRAQGARNV